MNDSAEQYKRKIFQRVKGMSLEKFWHWSNSAHTNAYRFAEKHYDEALFMELPPKQVEKVKSRVEKVRGEWDGVSEITLYDTGAWHEMTIEHGDREIAMAALRMIEKYPEEASRIAAEALRKILNS